FPIFTASFGIVFVAFEFSGGRGTASRTVNFCHTSHSMGNPISASSGIRTIRQPPPTGPRGMRRRRRRMQPAALYMLVFAALVALAIVVQLIVHMARTDPRDSRAIAERELRLNTLRPDERVIRLVSVFKR